MSERFRRGLVVGKFAPLHRGHELLIHAALKQCDQLVILSYTNPEFDGSEPTRRREWLAQCFPAAQVFVLDGQDHPLPPNEAPDDVHRHFVADFCLSRLAGPVDAVFTSEDYGDGFATVLTGRFQSIWPDAPVVRHVCVDRMRKQVPISATRIRQDVHANRVWLDAGVYASFVRRVCLLGGESTGKSTLAAALAAECRTVFAAEYGRERWEAQHGQLAYEDLLEIGQEQVAREQRLLREADRVLFCDTSPLTTLFYSQAMFGRVDPLLVDLANRPYDLTVLCAPDFPFVQDGTRQPPDFRDRQHHWYQAALAERDIPYLLAEGTLESRIRQIRVALGG